MLRLVVVALLLANAAYFAWTQGLLAPLGLQPTEQTESHRLQEQLRPEAVRLLNAPRPGADESPAMPAEVVSTPEPTSTTGPTAAPVTTACWRAGSFSTEQAPVLRRALQAVPELEGLWQIDEALSSGRWIVYMGRFNEELMQRKKAELKEMNVEYREVRVAPLSPGLALGTFSTEAAAQQGLANVARKGVRSARVEQERPETTVFVLRLPAITDEQRLMVEALGAALAGKTLQPCE